MTGHKYFLETEFAVLNLSTNTAVNTTVNTKMDGKGPIYASSFLLRTVFECFFLEVVIPQPLFQLTEDPILTNFPMGHMLHPAVEGSHGVLLMIRQCVFHYLSNIALTQELENWLALPCERKYISAYWNLPEASKKSY